MALNVEIKETIEYLQSNEAIAALNNDPYWPKWDTPWWRIMTLFEMEQVSLAPEKIINLLIDRINANYIKTFPLYEEDIPEGTDPYRQIPCHCALGTIYQALFAYGIDVDERLPWLRPWFLKYQLPDGGLNCDEQAYTNSKKSSIVSTMPPLESILYCTPNGLNDSERNFVDHGARYLINHGLIYRSRSSADKANVLLDPAFLELSFPRFYNYDFLRGLVWLIRWKQVRLKNDANDVIEEGQKLLQKKLVKTCEDNVIITEKLSYDKNETLSPGHGSQWEWRPAKHFPLLLKLSKTGQPSLFLKKYYDIARNLE